MSVSTISSRRRLTAALLCVATVLGAATGIAKADGGAPAARSVVVRYRDLDLGTQSGAATLYRRIQLAAHKVCPDTDSRKLNDKAAVWSCRRQAVERAVESINSPQVATLLKNPRLASTH
jgi:UrcA family protein